jgi:citrate lyase beta subunit
LLNPNESPRARRCILYVPGSEPRKIDKASGLSVDCVCLDLEDGVAPNRKGEARTMVARALRTQDFGRSEKLVRINAVGSGMEDADLEVVLPAKPDTIVIPKVGDAAQVQWADERIRQLERDNGLEPGHTALIGMIESARGLLNLAAIAAASSRLQGLIFGAEDYAADVGAQRTPGGAEVLYARSAIVAVCAAFNLQAIDLLYLDFHDSDGLRAEARRGVELGYAGMQAIHPNQVPTVQDAFTPDAAQIASALKIVEAAHEHAVEGRGAFALDNKMVDMPIIRAAERILVRARAAGRLS